MLVEQASGRFPGGSAPSRALSQEQLPGLGQDWAIHTDREQMVGRGWWLCTLNYGHRVAQGIRPLV